MKKLTKSTLLFVLLCITLSASGQNPEKGRIWLTFDHFVGDQKLVLKETSGATQSGEQFKVTLFQYYVSNIRLSRADGSWLVLPQEKSYFLIRHGKPEAQRLQLSEIPEGKYTSIAFTIGVDSTRNTRDVSERKGVLDIGEEGKDMYWAWNSGYIHFKLEGTYTIPADSTAKAQKFMYHIGLFGGYSKPTLNNLREVIIPFESEQAIVSKKQNTEIAITTDILRLFNGLAPVSIKNNPVVMASPFSKNVADNFTRGLFKFSRIIRHSSEKSPVGIEAIPVQ